MKRLTFFIFTVLLALTSCASVQTRDSAGRYLQFHSPANHAILFQFTTVNKDSCLMVMEAFGYQKEFKTTLKYLSCSNISASNALPYYAKVKDQSFGMIEIETAVLSVCKGMIDEMGKKIAVVYWCREKP